MASGSMNTKPQALTSLLSSDDRDFLLRNNGDQVLVSELEGRMVGIYITSGFFRSSRRTTPVIVEIYEKLKEKGEDLEIVLISLDDDEESFKNHFKGMPWLALQFADTNCVHRLCSYFKLSAIPTLVIIGPDGSTVHLNVCDYIMEHRIEAYLFSPEKLAEFDEMEEAKEARRESQTLESLLLSDDLDFVLGKDGVKIPVSGLVGKTILFYFSCKACPPCRKFTPKLVEAYHEIKAKQEDFEVIFVSSDNDEQSFEEYYSEMPGLVLPYNNKRETTLKCRLKVPAILYLVAVGPTGGTLTRQAKELVMFLGSDAFPFDDDHVREMEAKLAEMESSKKQEKATREEVPDDADEELGEHHEVGTNGGSIYDGEICYRA